METILPLYVELILELVRMAVLMILVIALGALLLESMR